MIVEPDPSALKAFWQEATDGLGLKQAQPAGHFHFGDTAELASDLVDEMLNGTKRATAGLVAEMEADGDKLPEEGDLWTVVDGSGEPRLVIRTLEIRRAPFHEADEAFAWDEGEGDRSFTWWRDAHLDYFRRSCRRISIHFSEDLEVLFERFDVLWPKNAAEHLLLRRPCTESQWSVYHQLRRNLFERYLPDLTYDPDFSENWTKDVFHFGMVSADEMLGCLQIRWLSATEASLHLVAIEERQRGQGIGRRMLLEGEAFLRANGRQLIRVFAEPEAEGFYRRLGFENSTDWTLKPLGAGAAPLKKTLTT